MDFKDWLLNEMPISNFKRIGNWDRNAQKKYGFSSQDAGIIGNDKAVAKIIRRWSNTKQNFDLYLVRTQKAYKHVQRGQVSPEFVQQDMGVDMQPNPEAISILFTNNFASDKMPMNSWTLGHRLGHALVRTKDFYQLAERIKREFHSVFDQIYGSAYNERNRELELVKFAFAVGTMKSARDRNLRNFYEFIFELLAQYINTGKIKFNPIPKNLLLQNAKAWGRPAPRYRYGKQDQADKFNEYLADKAEEYTYSFDWILGKLVGSILVM